jgi:hypothetical protein
LPKYSAASRMRPNTAKQNPGLPRTYTICYEQLHPSWETHR